MFYVNDLNRYLHKLLKTFYTHGHLFCNNHYCVKGWMAFISQTLLAMEGLYIDVLGTFPFYSVPKRVDIEGNKNKLTLHYYLSTKKHQALFNLNFFRC